MRKIFFLLACIACAVTAQSHAADKPLTPEARWLIEHVRKVAPNSEITSSGKRPVTHLLTMRDAQNRTLLIMRLSPASMTDLSGTLGIISNYLKYAPQTAAILGTPFPPTTPIYIEPAYEGMPMAGFSANQGVLIGKKRIALIMLNMNSFDLGGGRFNASILVHELGHAIVQNTHPEEYKGYLPCADRRLCEVESQLVQMRLFPQSIPHDMAKLTVALNAVPLKNQDAHAALLLRDYLMASDYVGYDYGLGLLLGDVLIKKMGLEGKTDMSPVIERIIKAKNIMFLEDTLRTLGFETLDELNDLMGEAYKARLEAIRNNPIANRSFLKSFLDAREAAERLKQTQMRLAPAAPNSPSYNPPGYPAAPYSAIPTMPPAGFVLPPPIALTPPTLPILTIPQAR